MSRCVFVFVSPTPTLSVSVSVSVGPLYRERVESCIKSEWVRKEVFMIEPRPSGRMLRPDVAIAVASRGRVGVVMWWCDTMRWDGMRSDQCEIALSHAIISSSPFPAGRQLPKLGRYRGTSVPSFTTLLTNPCNRTTVARVRTHHAADLLPLSPLCFCIQPIPWTGRRHTTQPKPGTAETHL